MVGKDATSRDAYLDMLCLKGRSPEGKIVVYQRQRIEGLDMPGMDGLVGSPGWKQIPGQDEGREEHGADMT